MNESLSFNTSSTVTTGSTTQTHQSRTFPFGGQRWSRGSDPSDIDFTGQRRDSFGLLDYNARFYDPAIGRFISADTIVPDFANPQDLNRYSYVRNNPLRFTDPTGHQCAECIPQQIPWSDIIKMGGSLAVSAPEAAVLIVGTGSAMAGSYLAIQWVLDDPEPIIIYDNPAIDGNVEGIDLIEDPQMIMQPTTPMNNTVGTELLSFPLGEEQSPFLVDETPIEGPIISDYVHTASVNQIDKMIQRGQAPKGFERADKGIFPGEQDHIHVNNGALNADGTWKHLPNLGLTNKQKKWLKQQGWTLPLEDSN